MNTILCCQQPDQCIQKMMQRAENYVRREPGVVLVAAFSAGLFLRLLPSRIIARPLATLAVTLLPSALMSLGVVKALEICTQHCHIPESIDQPA